MRVSENCLFTTDHLSKVGELHALGIYSPCIWFRPNDCGVLLAECEKVHIIQFYESSDSTDSAALFISWTIHSHELFMHVCTFNWWLLFMETQLNRVIFLKTVIHFWHGLCIIYFWLLLCSEVTWNSTIISLKCTIRS